MQVLFVAWLRVKALTGDRKQPVLAIKLHQDDPGPLLLVREKLGGKIYGPYCHDGRRYYFWRLMGKSLYASLPLFADLLPECRKRDQFMSWIEKYGLTQTLETMRELERVVDAEINLLTGAEEDEKVR